MQRYPQSLRAMNMRKTRRIGDNSIRNKWTPPIIDIFTERIILDLVHVCSIARLITGFPASLNDLLHFPSALQDCATSKCCDVWEKYRVFTMKAINSAGSPPILKNSSPPSLTKSRKAKWVASRTRCPCFLSSFPSATKG
jgi:hypothetical protein